MVYPNYYARRFASQAAWHKPGNVWGARRYGSQALRRRGYQPGAHVRSRYGAAYQQRRWNWLRHPGVGSGIGYGYAPSSGFAPQPPGSRPARSRRALSVDPVGAIVSCPSGRILGSAKRHPQSSHTPRHPPVPETTTATADWHARCIHGQRSASSVQRTISRATSASFR